MRISSSKQRKIGIYSGLRKGESTNTPGVSGSSFKEILTEEESKADGFEQQIKLVDEAAALLLNDPNQANLECYTKAVKAFLEKAIKRTYQVSEQRRFDRYGVQRLSVSLEIVDEKLQELIKEVLNSNKKVLHLANKLDEIRGLLFDFYQ